jgi:hypothetical protein
MSEWSGGKMTALSIKVIASWRLISGESFNTIVPIDKNLYTDRADEKFHSLLMRDSIRS